MKFLMALTLFTIGILFISAPGTIIGAAAGGLVLARR